MKIAPIQTTVMEQKIVTYVHRLDEQKVSTIQIGLSALAIVVTAIR